MKLRPYQIECVSAIEKALAVNRSCLVVMATGLGKTETFLEVADRHKGTVIILAHRDELVTQPAERMKRRGIPCGIEKGGDTVKWHEIDPDRPIICSSVQTLSRPRRQERLMSFLRENALPTPSLLIIDEAHHATSSTYVKVKDWLFRNPACKLLGVTATPNRADNLALEAVFDRCDTETGAAFHFDIADAIPQGWLVPIEPHAILVNGLDFSKVRTCAGDLNEADLERILTEEEHLHKVAAPTADLSENHSTLVFCVTVRHAELLAKVIERYMRQKGNNAQVVAISGKTEISQRREIIEAYKRGQIQVLLNCALFLEGFDAPNTSCVVMARPTKSLPLYTQVIGRGTRPEPGVVDRHDTAQSRLEAIAASSKPKMIVLDFVGNSGRHKLISSVDVLGGKYPEEVKDFAKEAIVENGKHKDTAKALAQAQALMELMKERDEMLETEKAAERAQRKRERIVGDVNYQSTIVNPFGHRGAQANNRVFSGPANPASEKQLGYLKYLARKANASFTDEQLRSMSKKQAGAVISSMKSQLGIP